MKKIPTLYQRNQKTRSVTDEVTTGCECVRARPRLPEGGSLT